MMNDPLPPSLRRSPPTDLQIAQRAVALTELSEIDPARADQVDAAIRDALAAQGVDCSDPRQLSIAARVALAIIDVGCRMDLPADAPGSRPGHALGTMMIAAGRMLDRAQPPRPRIPWTPPTIVSEYRRGDGADQGDDQ